MKLLAMAILAGGIALSQETHHTMIYQTGPDQGDVLFHKEAAMTGNQATISFVSADMAVEGKTIKGAPYSADTVNESVQVLADGNRIVHKNTGSVYRDSEGRMRREQTLQAIGPWSTSGDASKTIIINDTVAGTTYFLDTKNKEANKLPMLMPPSPDMLPQGAGVAGVAGVVHSTGPVGLSMATADVTRMRGVVTKDYSDMKSESLGKQTIEGLVCEGTRITTTIAQGAMGNEKPIEMVTERWYSPELQVVVLSKHSDPRMGESTYKLQNVSRAEPARSLFEVPADYAVVGPENGRIRKLQAERKLSQ